MRILLFITLISVSFALSATAQSKFQKIDQVVKGHYFDNSFEGAVLVAKDGEILYEIGVGWADRTEMIPITVNTKFRIAAMTKAFTAILVMQAVEEGLLQTNQTIGEWLPDYPNREAAQQVQIHHLLQHTSGLPNEPGEAYRRPLNMNAFVNSYAGKALLFTPGSTFNYTNLDYLTLSLILEKAFRQPYSILLRERILTPASMENTGLLNTQNQVDKLAKGYMLNERTGRLQPEPEYSAENLGGSGGMYSTIYDLLKWDQLMYGDELLSPASKAKMYTPNEQLGFIAYGNWVYDNPYLPGNPMVIERRGSILGASGVIMRFIEDNLTLIILSNNDTFNPDSFGNAKNMKEQICKILYE